MEPWFIFVLVSVLFTGVHIFTQKIAVTRGYNSSLLNTYNTMVSAVLGFVLAGIFEGFGELSWYLLGIGFLSGIIYIIGANIRMDSLRYVDATIILPLHKFVSPLIVLFFGVLFFAEILTLFEWIGVMLGMFVPLLLISRTEKSRQNNLTRGLVLMVVSAGFAAMAAVVNKTGADTFTSVILFAAVANAFSAVVGAALYRLRKKSVDAAPETHFLDKKLIILGFIGGALQVVAFATYMLAFAYGGALAVVYTIHSLYIVIPIVLATIFFKEHWNIRKVIAIVLSIAAIGLMR